MDLHHIGIVSKKEEIDKFLFNKKFEYKIIDRKQNNILYFYFDSNKKIWFEYICPANSSSTVSNFLNKKGPGLHHLGYAVKDIKKTTEIYKKKNNFLYISSYEINIPCFGGLIKTSFFYNNNIILEFLSNEK
jgi:hypothetical protein|tara:strand:- start:4717 stop:5112 length:396 start_codon:yes stop_codon:yes gene_type:complete